MRILQWSRFINENNDLNTKIVNIFGISLDEIKDLLYDITDDEFKVDIELRTPKDNYILPIDILLVKIEKEDFTLFKLSEVDDCVKSINSFLSSYDLKILYNSSDKGGISPDLKKIHNLDLNTSFFIGVNLFIGKISDINRENKIRREKGYPEM